MKSKSIKNYICGILAILAAIVILVMDTAEQNCTAYQITHNQCRIF